MVLAPCLSYQINSNGENRQYRYYLLDQNYNNFYPTNFYLVKRGTSEANREISSERWSFTWQQVSFVGGATERVAVATLRSYSLVDRTVCVRQQNVYQFPCIQYAYLEVEKTCTTNYCSVNCLLHVKTA